MENKGKLILYIVYVINPTSIMRRIYFHNKKCMNVKSASDFKHLATYLQSFVA